MKWVEWFVVSVVVVELTYMNTLGSVSGLELYWHVSVI
jgi:hypothetical protein